MPFSVKAYIDDHPLTLTKETAKEGFAKAIGAAELEAAARLR
jgi:hypothetical protein